MSNYILLKISENIVVVLESVIKKRNESEAVSELLRLLCSYSYFNQLFKFFHFECQLRLYVKIYLSDCLFKINTISLYSSTSEVCITVCMSINKDFIKNLCEILIHLTEEEKQRLV